MRVTLRGDRLIIDTPSMGLLIAALDTAAESWLESAAANEQADNGTRKAMLKMAGQAKALLDQKQLDLPLPESE